MAGLIQKQRAPEAEGTVPAPMPGQDPGEELTPQAVRAQLTLPPELKDAYDRVVLSGMKIMFDPKTHEMAMSILKGEGDIAQRLGNGIVTLMGTMVGQSNNTMPPQIIIPAGLELAAAAGDYLKRGGVEPITNEQIGGAMQVYVDTILDKFGASDPAKLQSMLGGQGPAEPAPQGGGLLSGAMQNG